MTNGILQDIPHIAEGQLTGIRHRIPTEPEMTINKELQLEIISLL